MENTKNISSHQLMLLTVILILLSGYIYIPTLSAPPANQDVWITEVLSIFSTFIIGFPLLFLSKKFNNDTLIQFIEKICGKFLGKFLSSLYILFIIFIIVLICSGLCQFVVSTIMPETPYYIIAIMFFLTGAYGAYKGIEVIAMGAEFFTPLVLCIIILFTLLNINNIDLNVFLPILSDSNFKKMNIGILNASSRCYDIILLFMFIPNLKNKNNINKIFCYSIIIAIVFIIVITVSTQGVLGVEQSKHAMFPYFLYSQKVNLLDFIQRIESLNVIGWFLTTFIKASALIYAASLGMKQIFNTKSYKPFIIPIVLISFIAVFKTPILKSVVFQLIVGYKVFIYISTTFMFIIPLFLLAIYLFRKKYITSK